MILAFEFRYLLSNGVLEALLSEICNDFSIPYALEREAQNVTLYVQGNEEALGKFGDFLGNSLPLSVFFKSSSVYVADKFPSTQNKDISFSKSVVFTPKHLQASTNPDGAEYLLPYLDFQKGHDVITFQGNQTDFQATDTKSLNQLYDALTQALFEGQYIACGEYVLGRVEAISKLISSTQDVEIIATDLSVVERMVVIRENEIKALATLERPAILCKVNAFYAQKNILPMQRVWLKLCDTLFLYHLSLRLFAKGVQFLFKAPLTALKKSPNALLKGSKELIETKLFRVCVLENGEIMIVKGNQFASKSLLENRQKFSEASHAVLTSILQEHRLFDTNVSCFYLSKVHDDKIMSYSKEHGILDLTRVILPHSFEALFDAIARSSKSAERLVENYQKSFPDIYKKAFNTAIPANSPHSIFTLWKMIAIILGLSSTFEDGAQKLMELAEDFGGQKGPRMDYFLQKEETLVADLDYVRLIRSGMSFKLAGSDDQTLSFGYMQSLAYFISDTLDSHKESFGTQAVALGGSLFGCRRLSEMVYKNLKPNHSIYFNIELPIECDE